MTASFFSQMLLPTTTISLPSNYPGHDLILVPGQLFFLEKHIWSTQHSEPSWPHFLSWAMQSLPSKAEPLSCCLSPLELSSVGQHQCTVLCKIQGMHVKGPIWSLQFSFPSDGGDKIPHHFKNFL